MEKEKRIENGKNKVIKDLLEKNIPFELIGTNPIYKNRASITNFRCKKCGAEKLASAHNIINNHDGCLKCGKKKKRTFEEFKKIVEEKGYELLSTSEEIKGEKTEVNTNTTALFKHSCGNIFSLKIHKFLEKGCHCKLCSSVKKKTNDEFINDLKKYGDIFFFSEGDNYNGRHNEVTLTCKLCGNKTTDFAYNFITNGRCCSFCNMSRAEQIVYSKYNGSIGKNVSFDGLVYIQKLLFDFEKNGILLECDGDQHFRSIDKFGGNERFLIQQDQDFTKDKYVLDNNLTLIRIHSKEIKNDLIDSIFNSSTTIETLSNTFENILYIREGKILLCKGLYKNSKIVEYTQVSGNGNEKDIV